MLSKWEGINDSHYSMPVCGVLIFKLLENLVLDFCIIHIKLFVPANLQCNLPVSLFDIKALHNLTEGALVHDITYLIAIAYLLSKPCSVVSFDIGDLLQIVSPVASDSEYLVKLAKLRLFKHCELILILSKSLLRRESQQVRWVRAWHSSSGT